MKKFLVTYLAPASVIAEWKKTDLDTRKAAEEKMQAEWKKWMNDHANIFAEFQSNHDVNGDRFLCAVGCMGLRGIQREVLNDAKLLTAN